MTRAVVVVFILLLSFGAASAQNCNAIPNTLTNGTNADANQVMGNFNYVAGCVNTLANSLAVPRSYLAGLTLSASGSSSIFGIAPGAAADSTNVAMMVLPSAYAKTTATWTAGSGNGALDTGTIANSTWYHAYLIKRVDTGAVDVLVSLSATAATLPNNYTLSRRIGSMKTDSSGNWIAFTQNGDEFLWLVGTNEFSGSAFGTSATLQTLNVPTGVKVNAVLAGAWGENNTQTYILISSPDETDSAPGGAVFSTLLPAGVNTSVGQMSIRTNSIGQIRMRASNSSTTLVAITQGWIDTRGRLN